MHLYFMFSPQIELVLFNYAEKMCGISLSLSMILNEEGVCVLQIEWPCVCVCVDAGRRMFIGVEGLGETDTYTGQQFAQSQVSFSFVNVLKVNFQEQGLGGSFLLICSP